MGSAVTTQFGRYVPSFSRSNLKKTRADLSGVVSSHNGSTTHTRSVQARLVVWRGGEERLLVSGGKGKRSEEGRGAFLCCQVADCLAPGAAEEELNFRNGYARGESFVGTLRRRLK